MDSHKKEKENQQVIKVDNQRTKNFFSSKNFNHKPQRSKSSEHSIKMKYKLMQEEEKVEAALINKKNIHNLNSDDDFIIKTLNQKENFKKVLYNTYLQLDKQIEKYLLKVLKIKKESEQNSPIKKNIKKNNKEVKQERKKMNMNKAKVEKIMNSFHMNNNFFDSIIELIALFNSFIDSFNNDITISEFIKEKQEIFINSWIIHKLDSKKLKVHKEIQELINQSFQIFNNKVSNTKIYFKFRENDNVDERRMNFYTNKETLTKIKFKKREKIDFDTIFSTDPLRYRDVKTFNGNIVEESEYNTLKKEKEQLERQRDPSAYSYILLNEKIYSTPEKEKFPGIISIKMKRCNFADVELWEKFPNLDYLYIENSAFSLLKLGNRFFPSLTRLELTKNNITNNEFQNIMERIICNQDLLANLQLLSFQDNKITKVEYLNCQGDDDEIVKFTSLTELNFEDNRVFKVSIEFLRLFPQLRLLNLDLNNFAFETAFVSLEPFFKEKNIFALMNRNLFAIKKRFRDKYYEFFISGLKNLDYPLKKLSFETVYNKFNVSTFQNIELHPIILEHLKILNLSFCAINDNVLCEFFKKNVKERSFSNLKELSLCSNLLTENIFDSILKCDYFRNFDSLELIDLSANEKILSSKMLNSLEMLLERKQIRRVVLFRTLFEENIKVFLKEKLIEKKPQKDVKIDKENDVRIANDFTNFFNELRNKQIKTVFYIKDLLGKKTLAVIQNVYKDPFKFLKFQKKLGNHALS